MSTRKKPTGAAAVAPAPAAADDAVLLRCEDLGETRPFEPAHAKRLLAYQEHLQLSGDSTWQPVASDSSDPE